MMSSSWRYADTLKDPDVEEPINLALHRPLAFQLLRPLERWRVRPTPNQITLLSGLFGFSAAFVAYAAATRGAHLLPVAGGLLLISVILDCCDGMLARLVGASSELGRILDGGMDFFVGIAVGIGMGAAAVEHVATPWTLALVVAIFPSMVAHAAVFDHLRQRFAQLTGPERQVSSDSTQSAASRGPLAWALETVYRHLYTPVARAVTGAGDRPRPAGVSPEQARAELRRPMRMAGWLGVGTHFAILYASMIAAALAPSLPLWSCTILVTVALNVWMLVTASAWRRAEARLLARAAD